MSAVFQSCADDALVAWSRWRAPLQAAGPASWCVGGDVSECVGLLVIDAGTAGPQGACHSGPWPRPTCNTLVLVAPSWPGLVQAWLDAGADMAVPADVPARELEARLRALLRPLRRPAPAASHPVCLDLGSAGLRWRDGRRLALSAREAQLLAALARRQGRPGTKMELLLDLGWRQEGRTPTFVELVVSRLRARLRAELGEEAAQAIQTCRGAGYAWRPEGLPERV